MWKIIISSCSTTAFEAETILPVHTILCHPFHVFLYFTPSYKAPIAWAFHCKRASPAATLFSYSVNFLSTKNNNGNQYSVINKGHYYTSGSIFRSHSTFQTDFPPSSFIFEYFPWAVHHDPRILFCCSSDLINEAYKHLVRLSKWEGASWQSWHLCGSHWGIQLLPNCTQQVIFFHTVATQAAAVLTSLFLCNLPVNRDGLNRSSSSAHRATVLADNSHAQLLFILAVPLVCSTQRCKPT